MTNLDQIKTVSGHFTVPPSNNRLYGQLHLDRTKSYLHLLSSNAFDHLKKTHHSVICGLLDNGDHVTLLNCTFSGMNHHLGLSGEMYKYTIYPRVILSGNDHFYPDNSSIKKVCFEIDDAMRIFHSSPRVGTIRAGQDLMKIISEYNGLFDISSKSFGWISYFIGPIEFLRCDTQYGTVLVNACTGYQANLTLFVDQDVKVITFIENEHGNSIDNSIIAMKTFSQLMGIIAGKQQNLNNIEFVIESKKHPYDVRLNAYLTAPIIHPNVLDSRQQKIDSYCLLIDPIQKKEEFSIVVGKWFEKSKIHTVAVARARVLSEWGSLQYSTDRLIRVASAFDLLEEKSKEKGLANKIITRSKPILDFLPENMKNNLKDVIQSAITCRNQFVHGPRRGKHGVDYGNCVIFYSDTLEFVFLTSDLVDCGWDMKSWMTQEVRGWHLFFNYINTFEERHSTCTHHISSVN